MTRLDDKTILVTGASGGIGSEIARLMGRRGANVIAQWGRNQDGAALATADIPDDRKLLIGADFSEPGAVGPLWNEALAWKGRIDVVVNNAAVMPEAGIDDTAADWDEAWDLALTVNVIQPTKLLRSAVKHYLAGDGGIIVTLSSWAAQRGSGNPKLAAYSASKAAMAAATKTIARSYARDNVLAYCIAPGPVDTEMTHRSVRNQGGMDKVLAGLSIGEIVPPVEVAEIACFLSSGAARHLTGATLDVNGATYIR